METLGKVAEWLGRGTSAYLPSTQIFPRIDADDLARRLRIRDLARERASKEEPPTGAETLDAVEQDILRHIADEIAQGRSYALRELQGYGARLSATRLDTKEVEIRNVARDAVSQFGVEIRDGSNRLNIYFQNVRDAHGERKRFRERNALERPVDEPSSLLLYWGLITVLFTIEIVFNSFFFAVGLETGLLGGAIEAVLFALPNIGSGLLVGWYLYPLMNHVSGWKRWYFRFGAIVHFALVAVFNVAVAHYRIALQGPTPENAAHLAVQTLISNPLLVNDMHSLLLIVVGVMFSIFAAVDGYRMQDPYPGYSRVQKRYRSFADQYAYYQRTIVDELEEVKNQAVDVLSQLKDEIPRFHSDLEGLLGSQSQLIKEFDEHCNHLQRCCLRLITLYREENKRARSSETPAYFMKAPELPKAVAIDVNNGPRIDLEKQSEVAAGCTEELEAACQKIYQQFDELQRKFPLLEQIFSEADNEKAR